MQQPFEIEFDLNGMEYVGWVIPSEEKKEDGTPTSFHVDLNGTSFGNVSCNDTKWTADEDRPQEVVDAIGDYILNWRE